MTRIELRVELDPPAAHAFMKFARRDGGVEYALATVDTGAEISLFPLELLDIIEVDPAFQTREIERAGMSDQTFKAIETMVNATLEDANGNAVEVKFWAWFAKTDQYILGFDGVLDRATLYLDMRQTHTGWMELNG